MGSGCQGGEGGGGVLGLERCIDQSLANMGQTENRVVKSIKQFWENYHGFEYHNATLKSCFIYK